MSSSDRPSRSWCLEWAAPDGGLTRTVVTGVDGLDAALDDIGLSAVLGCRTYEVDMWRVTRSSGDPVLIQFLVGHSRRGCLLWHEDGESFAAVDRAVPALPDEIEYVRVDGRHLMEPVCARLRPETVRDALAAYLLTDDRPGTSLDWVLAPAD
jgi:hypothetical protein